MRFESIVKNIFILILVAYPLFLVAQNSDKLQKLMITVSPSSQKDHCDFEYFLYSSISDTIYIDVESFCLECLVHHYDYDELLSYELDTLPYVLDDSQLLLENKKGEKRFFNQFIEGKSFPIEDFTYIEEELVREYILNDEEIKHLFHDIKPSYYYAVNENDRYVRLHYIHSSKNEKYIISSGWIDLENCNFP